MWSDNETSEDLLGFKIHADLLIDVINDESVLPVTIGVFGDWGSGKSSILKIVKDELSGEGDDLRDETLVLYFNGWVFEGYDDAKAALLESIVEKFREHKTIGNKVKDQTTKLLKSVDWMRVLGLSFKKIIIPGAMAYSTGGLSLIPCFMGEFSKLDPKELGDKLQGEDAEDFLSGIIKKNEHEDTTLVREFREDFKEMIDKSEIKKLVVIIDDLDRCTPERLIENLEAIKLFLNVEKTAFIIGADPRIVRHAIEFRYKTDQIQNADDPNSRNKRIVSDYLEKLIQVPYNLPRLSSNEVETYITLLFCKKELGGEFSKVLEAYQKFRDSDRYGTFGFGNLEGVIEKNDQQRVAEKVSLIASLSPIITKGLNGNPRQIKRFLNTFTLRNRLVEVAKIPDFKIEVLAKLMVLEYSEPSLFNTLYTWQSMQSGYSAELKELEFFASEKDKAGLKEKFGEGWALAKIITWLNAEPALSDIDLRDYYWISRDRLTDSISGSSLIPMHVRMVFKKMLESGSASILKTTVSTEVKDKLQEEDLNTLYSLLNKELEKTPGSSWLHQIYVELMENKIDDSVESYERMLRHIDNKKIPFSLRNNLFLAEKKNQKIKQIYAKFEPESRIYKALNPKK
ncbi:ATPase [Marivirga lumbricoides]|uniref:ATPase n=1 Tax=Marivirga lumbricoides TaxID=1046115 RepID=A0ABQ1LZ77_9BACT|nr:ATPase [Marivirga lumbricoides]